MSNRIQVIVAISSLAAFSVLLFTAWLLGGWLGIAVVSSLFALLGVLSAGFLISALVGGQAELDRLLANMAGGEDVCLSDYRLGALYRRVGQNIQAAYNGSLQKLRETQNALQRAEVTLHVTESVRQQAEAIVHSLSDAVIVTNAFGEITLVNAEAERLFGFNSEGLIGKPVGERIGDPQLAGRIEQAIQRGLQSGRHTEELCFAATSKRHSYKVSTVPLALEGTEPHGLVTILRDITAEKESQNRSAEFLSAVSHEIKTPLSSVKAYAEMLANGDTDGDQETQQKFLAIIEAQTNRMTRMLESMLDLARIESGVVRIERRPQSLNELIEAGARLMQPAACEKHIQLQTQLSPLYLCVEVDVDMMSRVVMNLLSNAIKYTDGGGQVLLRTQMLGKEACFEVEDTGRGIPAEAMSKLFQRFYRVEENANAGPGTGLGLALVKHIVEELHAGQVEVESDVGKGSRFRVKLPLHAIN